MATAPAVAKELLAYAAHGVLLGLGSRLGRNRTPAREPSRRTTVLLHGYLAGGAVLFPLRRHLASRVEGQVLIYDYGGALDLRALARRFGAFVDEHAPHGRIDIVGHSAGGLIARYWMLELGGAPRVDRFVSLGTPHHGTESARLWPFASTRDLVPGAALLARLHARAALAAGVRHVCIVAENDLMVRPPANATLPGSDVHRLDGLGHNGLLFSSRVFRIVTEALAVP
jgi:triacylglycerol lipase